MTDHDYLLYTMQEMTSKVVNQDLAEYRENVESLKDAPVPNYEFSDFNFVDLEYAPEKNEYVFKGYILYGGMLFRLDYGISPAEFNQEEHDYLMGIDFSEMLTDPWTRERLDEAIKEQRKMRSND